MSKTSKPTPASTATKQKAKCRPFLTNAHSRILHVTNTTSTIGKDAFLRAIALQGGYSPNLSRLEPLDREAVRDLALDMTKVFTYASGLGELQQDFKNLKAPEKRKLNVSLQRLKTLRERIVIDYKDTEFRLRIKGLDAETRSELAKEHAEAADAILVEAKKAGGGRKKRGRVDGLDSLIKTKELSDQLKDPIHPLNDKVSALLAEAVDLVEANKAAKAKVLGPTITNEAPTPMILLLPPNQAA
jgi:hypothetical protein